MDLVRDPEIDGADTRTETTHACGEQSSLDDVVVTENGTLRHIPQRRGSAARKSSAYPQTSHTHRPSSRKTVSGLQGRRQLRAADEKNARAVEKNEATKQFEEAVLEELQKRYTRLPNNTIPGPGQPGAVFSAQVRLESEGDCFFADCIVRTARRGLYIVVEIDEQQHRSRAVCDESTRMLQMWEAWKQRGMQGGLLFVRFNPDAAYYLGGKLAKPPPYQEHVARPQRFDGSTMVQSQSIDDHCTHERVAELISFLGQLDDSSGLNAPEPCLWVGYAFYDTNCDGVPVVTQHTEFHLREHVLKICIPNTDRTRLVFTPRMKRLLVKDPTPTQLRIRGADNGCTMSERARRTRRRDDEEEENQSRTVATQPQKPRTQPARAQLMFTS